MNNEENTLSQYIKDLGVIMKELDFSDEAIAQMQIMKRSIHKDEEDYQNFMREKEKIKIRKIIPLKELSTVVEWYNTTRKKQEEVLWRLGFDTLNCPFFLDVGVFTWEGKRYCETYVIGSERLDYEWLQKRINGKKVSSPAAQVYYTDPTLVKEMEKMSGRF